MVRDPSEAMTVVGLVGLALTTVTVYFLTRSAGVRTAGSGDADYIQGLLFSAIALVGNTGVSTLRKILAAERVGSAEQVGLSALLQGIGAVAWCVSSGKTQQLPHSTFWVAAVFSSMGAALVKTLETKAFAESHMSLCAPFLAFDPVMQFLVGVAVIPLTCSFLGIGCAELKSKIPVYHILSVVSIATGAFALGRAGTGGKGEKDKDGNLVTYWGPLPVGSWLILLNCVIYGFTFRLDKAAVKASSTTIYYMYGRLIMAATTFSGARAAGQMTQDSMSKFLRPKVAGLIGLICAADAVYMLSLYKAVSLMSPVYVAAIKRGGGVLVSSLLGSLIFGEPLAGRRLPILTIVVGVVVLCMKD